MNQQPAEQYEATLLNNLRVLNHYQPGFVDRLGSLPQSAAAMDAETMAHHQSAMQAPRAQQQIQALWNALQQNKRLIICSGAGPLFFEAVNALNAYPYSAIVFLDPSIEHWRHILALQPVPAGAALERLVCYTGEQAFDDLMAWIKNNALALLPASQQAYLFGGLTLDPGEQQQYHRAAKQVAHQLSEQSASLDRKAAQFFAHARSAPPRQPQRVWACTNADSYIHFSLAQCFLDGFARQGLATHHTPFRQGFAASFAALGDLFKTQPELIFSINTWPAALLEDLGIVAQEVEAMRMPGACWLVDDTSLYEDEPSQPPLRAADWVFMIDDHFATALPAGFKQYRFLPPASQFEQAGHYQERFDVPIAYVGSLPKVEPWLSRLNEIERETLQVMEAGRKSCPRKPFRELLHEQSPSPQTLQHLTESARAFCATTHKGFQKDQAMLEYFLYNCATYLKRLQWVLPLLPLGLHVYGPDTWQTALPAEFRSRYRGFVDANDLAGAYASARLSLNLHSHQCLACLNPRDFDVPGAGGVCLGDWVPDMQRGLLEPGQDTVAVYDPQEACSQAELYLKDEDARRSIQQRGMQRVRQAHTYAHRAAEVLRVIQGQEAPSA